MTLITPFLGIWVLQPERSEYQLGQPPAQGRYTLVPEAEQVRVVMEWTDTAGKTFQQAYYSIPDGQDHPYADNPAVDSVSMTVVSPLRLDTDAKKGGQMISHAARELIDDGQTMKITMTTYTPSGTFANVAYYTREA